MSIGPEHIVAVICAIAGYAVVSAAFRFRAKPSEKAEEPKSESRTSTNSHENKQQWFDILGVSPSASLNEIKAAYRAKISGYHPDKVASLAEELRQIAEERSKAINDAYATAIRLKK